MGSSPEGSKLMGPKRAACQPILRKSQRIVQQGVRLAFAPNREGTTERAGCFEAKLKPGEGNSFCGSSEMPYKQGMRMPPHDLIRQANDDHGAKHMGSTDEVEDNIVSASNHVFGDREILDIKAAAIYLGISRSHLSHILAGKVAGVPAIPHVRAGRRALIRRAVLDQWLLDQEHGVAASLAR